MTKLAEAEAAHAAACSRLAELDAVSARAQQAAADAQHAADRALTRAAAGEAVGVNDLAKLRDAATKAADTASPAAALRAAGQRRVDEAQAELFQARAADLARQQAELTAAARRGTRSTAFCAPQAGVERNVSVRVHHRPGRRPALDETAASCHCEAAWPKQSRS